MNLVVEGGGLAGKRTTPPPTQPGPQSPWLGATSFQTAAGLLADRGWCSMWGVPSAENSPACRVLSDCWRSRRGLYLVPRQDAARPGQAPPCHYSCLACRSLSLGRRTSCDCQKTFCILTSVVMSQPLRNAISQPRQRLPGLWEKLHSHPGARQELGAVVGAQCPKCGM